MGVASRSRLRKDLSWFTGSKRRDMLGTDVKIWSESSGYYRTRPVRLSKTVLNPLFRENSWELLDRSKMFLASRKPSQELIDALDVRREWNRDQRIISTVLDLFPGLKYSYSSFLPVAHRKKTVNLLSSFGDNNVEFFDGQHSVPSFQSQTETAIADNSQRQDDTIERSDRRKSPPSSSQTETAKFFKSRGRVEDIARSHNYRLDPVDAPKELFKYQLRIADVLAYGYCVGMIPIMMTLTVFHRWHPLAGLVNVLQKSRSALFDGRQGRRIKKEMGLFGYINRMEETINDTPDNNNGWHPHYHVVLFIPAKNLEKVSAMEADLKKRWVSLVSRYFKEEFDEEIPASYYDAFCEHGLVFSRYSKGDNAGELRPVKDSQYLAKIMGYDPADVYGGDKELATATLKDSKIPFDLLCETTANNIDLWNEYAIALKGVVGFRFSKGLEQAAKDYFEQHPDKKPRINDCPREKVVARLENAIYQLFYRNYKIPQLLKKITEGYDALVAWVKETLAELGYEHLCDNPMALPRPPTDDGLEYALHLDIDNL